MSSIETIQACLDLYKNPSYLEIGVATGWTFHGVKAHRKVAVDPSLEFNVEEAKRAHPECEYHQITSDQFFSEYASDPFDVVYIDGLHTAEQTLRDLLNTLSVTKKSSLVVLDDVFPDSYAASLPSWDDAWVIKAVLSPDDWHWMGDVYKLLYFIETFLQQYSFASPIGGNPQIVLWRQPRREVPQRTIAQIGAADLLRLYKDRAILREMPLADVITAAKAAGAGDLPS